MIAVATGVVQGVAVLFLVYKMVDGDLPAGPGICALIMIVLSMALAIRPPHPAVPGVILVLSLTLMAFFPFAEQKLEEFELRAIDANRLARSIESLRARPDNFAAKFELARLLYDHGFYAQAINLTGSTLAGLSTEKDEVKNRSVRDVFNCEDVLLKKWVTAQAVQDRMSFVCPGCGNANPPNEVFCTKCGRPYMLDKVRGQEVKPRVWAKLVIAWAALALFVPGVVAIGMNLDGVVRIIAFGVAMVAIAAMMAWLFRPPKHSAPIYG